MKTITAILLLLLSIQGLQAQTDSMEKKVEPATVTLLSQDFELRREIYETEDSALLMRIPVMKAKKDSLAVYSILSIPVTRIHTVTLRKKSIGKGIRNGALIGFGTGLVIGLLTVDMDEKRDPTSWGPYVPPEVVAVSAGLLAAVPGMIIGAFIGGFTKVVITIHGSQENYNRHRSRLAEFSVQKK